MPSFSPIVPEIARLKKEDRTKLIDLFGPRSVVLTARSRPSRARTHELYR